MFNPVVSNNLFPLINIQSKQSALLLEAADELRYDSGLDGKAYKMVAWTVINDVDLSTEVFFKEKPKGVPDEVLDDILASFALHQLVLKYYVEQNQ